jgi:predicted permease
MIRSSRTVSDRLFAKLLWLFPAAFRARFGQDMRELFRDQLRHARSLGGSRAVLELWIRVIPSLAHAALVERAEEWRAMMRETRARRRAGLSTTRGDSVLETLRHDLRFAVRMLRRSPVFTVVAVAIISLGCGAVTTIFSGINAVVLRPLPGTSDPDRLLMLERRSSDFREGVSGSYRYYSHLRERARTLAGVAAWSKASMSISVGGEGHGVYGNIVSGNYFSVLGERPALGRFFLNEEDRTPLANPVLVVSHDFWSKRLGGDTAAIGRTVNVNGHPFTIIGVTTPGFRGVFTPLKVDAWVPLMMQAQVHPGRDLADQPWLWMFARLAPNATRESARRELAGLTETWSRETNEPAAYRRYVSIRITDLTGLPDDARRAFLGFTVLLFGAAGLVLVIASVNVASMLSARAIARRREMALRTALGAARGRLVRQLLTESLLLFMVGSVGGVAVAWLATGALERIPIPGDASLSLELSPDPRVLAFALVVSLATGIVFGLAPALQGVGRDITTRLRNDSAAGSGRRSLAGNVLIVAQLALSLVLLVAAGLFTRALEDGARADPGFESSGVATATFNPESWGYDSARADVFYRGVRERVASIPGVTTVSYADYLPLTMSMSNGFVRPDGPGRDDDGVPRVSVGVSAIEPGYFDALEIPIRMGRSFVPEDDPKGQKVAVVNETFANRLWPQGGALGRTFGFNGDRVMVIGVARDSRYGTLTERAQPFVYVPLAQAWRPDRRLIVRTALDPAALAPSIRDIVRSLDPGVPRPVVTSLRQETSIVLFPQRVAATVTGVLGGVGLLLAAVGLYGLIAYSVGRRTREIGVRVALGAQRSDVLGMVIREGMRLAGTGVVLGVLLAAAATRLIAGFLFDVSPLDGLTFAGMSGLFVGVALLASYLPARRAAATDPVTALKEG